MNEGAPNSAGESTPGHGGRAMERLQQFLAARKPVEEDTSGAPEGKAEHEHRTERDASTNSSNSSDTSSDTSDTPSEGSDASRSED
ncbi:hypothetical protein ABT330_06625 [Streptomyces sp. NPDC000658]|uniref:hypothetical protein n=1 Tax=Streptomyces sp. NPDC000658 TaxID=3154266 RepID=UPI00332FD6E1